MTEKELKNQNLEEENLEEILEEILEEETEKEFDNLNISEEYGIISEMKKQDFLYYLLENNEIHFKNANIGISEWEDGKIDILQHAPETELGYIKLNKEQFDSREDAIDFAVDFLVEYAEDRNDDGTKTTSKGKRKSKSKDKKDDKPKQEIKKEEKFNGPRVIRVFGRDVYVETDTNITNEDIRIKLVNEFGFPNFDKDKVCFLFDESTGILEVALKFNTKG